MCDTKRCEALGKGQITYYDGVRRTLGRATLHDLMVVENLPQETLESVRRVLEINLRCDRCRRAFR